MLRISDFQNAIQKIITPETDGERLPPGAAFVSDRHPFFEILIALEGCCRYPLGSRLHTVTPGTAVVIPPWCRHAYGYRRCDTGLLHLWLYVQTSCQAGGVRVRHGEMTACPELKFTISPELHTLFLKRWESWEHASKTGMEKLFFQNILNLFLEEMALHEKIGRQPERNVVAETIALIRTSNGRGCSLEYLARQLCCSKYHLAHRVRQETGRTVGNFIEEARLRYVHSAREHGLTQKEIAWNLGFSSAAAFWNWLHRK